MLKGLGKFSGAFLFYLDRFCDPLLRLYHKVKSHKGLNMKKVIIIYSVLLMIF